MDWSNERILELIRNYEREPILWNRRQLNYKQKRFHYDAWVRIKNNLSWTITVKELKVKMKSLMAYYRTSINKYKKSLKSGAGTDAVYQTSWFAFEAMNRFLAPLYESQSAVLTPQIKKENQIRKVVRSISDEDSSIQRPKSSVRKKLRDQLPSHATEALQNMNTNSLDDEYDMFGKIIANKIRKLNDHYRREIVMNDIFQLVFRASTSIQN